MLTYLQHNWLSGSLPAAGWLPFSQITITVMSSCSAYTSIHPSTPPSLPINHYFLPPHFIFPQPQLFSRGRIRGRRTHGHALEAQQGRHRAPWRQQGNKLKADTENNKVIMRVQLAAVPTPGTAQRIFTTLLISRDEVWISGHAREGTGPPENRRKREQMMKKTMEREEEEEKVFWSDCRVAH